ncbi:MAG: beta-ketoacyl-ACP synthase II [Candidatus Brocadiia bacterium]
MGSRRVVITGMGAVSPVGMDCKSTWEAVREGRSGIGHIQAFDSSEYHVHIAGEIPEFDPLDYVSKRRSRRMDRFVQFAIAASDQALEQSGLLDVGVDPKRVGVYIGTGIGGLHEIEDQHTRLMNSGPTRTSPMMIPKLMTNAAAGQVSLRNGFKGPSFSVSSACASGSNAIGEAYRSIREGMVDWQVCGGSEAAVTPMGVSGFMQMKAISRRNDEPEKASRPFDKDRDGFVMAEGAAIFVMESLEKAEARGAEIFAEIVGYGASSDAYHMTLPCQEGAGARYSMINALADAGMETTEISYINAHGTGTPAGDGIEAKAIRELFKEYARELPVSSSKSIFGHLLGASGALETFVCIRALQENVCPPTINLETVDPECEGINLVPHTAQEHTLRSVMNNSFGFGGHNVCLILQEFEK